MTSLLTGPLRRPWLVLAFAFVLSAASVLLASRSHPSGSIQDLLGRRDPAARALARVLEDFPSADELLLLVSVDGDRPGEDAAAVLRDFAARLSASVTTDPSTAPLCRSVAYAADPQLLEFIKNEVVPAGLLYLSDEEFAAMLQRLSPQAMREQLQQDEAMLAAPGPAADALARTLIKDPLRLREFLSTRLEQQRAGFRTWQGGPEFISEDGRHLLVRIAGLKPPSDLAFCKEFTAKVLAVAASINPPGGAMVEPPRGPPLPAGTIARHLTIRASGAYAIAAASERAIRADLTSSIAWSVIIMQAVFLLGYRNLLAFVAAFAPVGLGLCVAFGAHALITPALTPLTAVIGASLVGCGIDYSIYLLSYYEAQRIADCGLGIADWNNAERGPAPGDRADQSAIPNPQSTMAAALRSLATPLIAGCLTSIVGFAAVACSRVHALRDFAVLGALGLAFALAGVLWVLPAMLMVASRLPRLASAGPRFDIGGLLRAICGRPRVFIGASAAVFAVGAVLALLRPVGFETDLNVMHPSPNPALETERAIGDAFGSAETMLVYTQSPTADGLVRDAYRVQAALAQTRSVEVEGVTGLPLLLPDPAAAPARLVTIKQVDVDRILADFDGAVTDSSFEVGAFAPYKDFLRKLLTATSGPTLATLGRYPGAASMLLSSKTLAPGAEEFEALTLVHFGPGLQDARARDRAVESIRAALAPIPGTTLTGLTVVGYDIEHAVRQDLPVIVGVASAAVFLLLIPSLRSLRAALLACTPVIFGIVVLLGYMAAARERLNLANMVAVPLLIGVGIDYGIFLVSMSQQGGAEGREGVLRRFASSAHAIVLTSTMSIIGFGSLAFTSTPAVRSMGRVVAVGIFACVMGTFFILAPMLARGSPNGPDEPHRR